MSNLTLINILKNLTQFSSLIIFILTLLSFFGRYLFLELTTHFRVQYLWTAIIFAVILIAFRSWFAVGLMVVTIVINGFYVLPYYFSESSTVQNNSAKEVKVMLANVEHLNKNYEKLLESVKASEADVVILQEITEAWWENVKALENDYQFVKSMQKQGGSGMAIFSRFQLESSEILQLDNSSHPAILNKFKVDEKILTLLAIHPPTPIRNDKFTNRNLQFAESAKLLRETPNPKVLIGDMNITMWSPYFVNLVRDSGMRDVRKGRGIYPSWVSFLPNPLRIAIDHCLASDDIEVVDIELGKPTGSDHLPLIVSLKISN